MSQHVITAPSPPFWRRRSFVIAALVALLAAGVGAAVGALVSSSSSVTYRSAPAPLDQATLAGPVAACTSDGTGDGAYLLALIASEPDGAGTRMAASLSPQALQEVGDATAALPFLSDGVPPAPDAPTVAAVLSRLPTADSTVVLESLAPDFQADVGASLGVIASLPTC